MKYKRVIQLLPPTVCDDAKGKVLTILAQRIHNIEKGKKEKKLTDE